MEIFNKLDESRIKHDLEFFNNYWHLRSVFNRYGFAVCTVDFYGNVGYLHLSYDLGIVPVCMI